MVEKKMGDEIVKKFKNRDLQRPLICEIQGLRPPRKYLSNKVSCKALMLF
jgi:hypothetical protein